MIKNYFVIAYRHLTRHKLFSLINILCLAVGIAFTLIIGVYVINQRNVNSELKNVKNQYVIKSKWKVRDMGLEETTFGMLSRSMKENYPNLVANYYRFAPVTNVVSAGEKNYREEIAIGDTNIVSMYGFKVLYGDKNQAFKNTNSAVITEKMAMKLYAKKDAVGQRLSVQTTTGNQQDYIVSAVLENMPYNSVTNFLSGDPYDVFLPTEGSRYFPSGDPCNDWNSPFIVSMIELQPSVKPADISQAFAKTLALNAGNQFKGNIEVELASLKDYYLKESSGSVQKMINTLSFIAVFILIMAIINFVNINIGTSSYRLKEIGLRKVFGSSKAYLIYQYLIESLLVTALAALIALLLYQMLRPIFNSVLNTRLDAVWQFDLYKITGIVLLVLSVGIIAGIYPAFVLSASKPVKAVKGKLETSKSGFNLRRILLTFQFAVAVIVFVCAINISNQITYWFKKDIGYNKDQLLVLMAFPKQWDSAGVARMISMRDGLLQTPGVKSATLSFEIPNRKPPNAIDYSLEGNADNQILNIPTLGADENYADAFQMKMLQGSFFKKGGAYTPGEIVLNESAAKAFGLTDAVGKKIRIPSANAQLTVAGIVKDFHYTSMDKTIDPLIFMHVNDLKSYRYITLKLASGDIAKTIDDVRKNWKSLSPNAPFEFTFMDDRFKTLYQTELQLKKASNIATGLNLIIVFMGIFGVMAFTLTKRTKEVAVRKVLGAGVKNIVILFIKDYAWLIVIANIIAWPIAYIITNRWLENYVYRIHQNILPFLFVGCFTFIAAFTVIGLQCLKTAIANPVKALKTE
ncbi:ABC transporter permease [Chitinophagaceae bacterium LWZ2-11]